MAEKHSQTCAIASALNVFGDRWTLLIVREAFYGTSRFGDFLSNTGISKRMLTDRLEKLIDNGILKRIAFADRGTKYKYGLTKKGQAIEVIMLAIQQWSEQHIYGVGNEPVVVKDRETGGRIPLLSIRSASGRPVSYQDVMFEAGASADERTRDRLKRISKANQRTEQTL